MENYKEKRLERKFKSQQTTSIVLAAILILSIIGNVFLFVRNSRISNEKEDIVQEKHMINENRLAVEETNAQLKSEIATLNERIKHLEEDVAFLELEIQTREARIGRLSRQVFDKDELRQQIDELEKVEDEYKKLQEEKLKLVAELETLKEQLSKQEEEYKSLADKVEEATYLHAYSVCVHNFRDRWLCRPVAMDVARRVDRTTVSFEINANIFVEPGEKDVYLLMTGPDGDIINPSAETFTIEETGVSSSFTRHTTIQYENQSVPLNFTVEHDTSLDSGTHLMKVYIDGKESGYKEFYLE